MPEPASAGENFEKPAAQSPSLDSVLAWDGSMQSVTLSNGMNEAHYTFHLTNISDGNVVISNVTPSCSCTVAKLPEEPWTLKPGAGGEIKATMDVTHEFGTLIKTLTVHSDKGSKVLFLRATVLPMTPKQEAAADREKNRRIAIADRQAVFQGDCAKCHAEPAKGKLGAALYVAACGICHDAEHRAPMVPDLHALPFEASSAFWKNWITYGKPDSLMPAFAKSEGGNLSDEQIGSLVRYLCGAIHPRAGE